MSTKEEKLQSLKQTIYALLVPYKNGCTIKQLTDDYYDVQGESIPFQQFGSGSLVNFLRSIQDTIYIEFNSGRHIVKCIPSQKSAHISALVAGQKITSKKGKCIRKQFRPSQFYPNVHIQPLHIPADVLSVVVDLVAKHPRGINKCEILQLIHRKMPNIYVSSQDLDEQLKQISHRVYTRGIFVYPCNPETKPPSGPSPPVQNEPIPSNANIYVGGCEDPDELHNYIDEDDFKFLPGGCTSSVSKKTNSSPRIPISRFIQDSLSNHPDLVKNETMRNTAQEKKEDSQEYSCNLDHEYSAIDISYFNNMDDDDANYFNDQNPEYVEILINDRVKIRLEKLIQKYPDGIWCAELPDKYLEEYKVPLCYVELGFSSVREFTSHLPTIFRCVPLNGTGDYKLYSATSEIVSRTNDKPVVSTLLDLHAMQGNILESETDVLPCIASIPTCKELIPDNVLTIGECVALISVESLANMDTQFQEVVVVEVFTPTFFWVQLRKHRKSFKKFMSELHRYYEDESSNYVIPSVVLEKGLNCACTYSGVWHRGIIKAVNPDLQVTVFFYDYGTLKTYPASHVRYLHRKFSHLPAQAIPCGLVNIKPYAGTKWTRTVTNEFAFKTCNIPLIATISTINEEDNSIMITLTDTSEEEDVHINDWMVERKLALHGKMVCMQRRHFLFEYYLQCRENRRKLIDEYSKKNSVVKHNNYGKHKHIVPASVLPREQTCPNSNENLVNTTKAVSTDLKNPLSTVCCKSRIHKPRINSSATSSSNTTANENACTKNSSGSSISSNPNFRKKASTRYEKLLSLLELSSKSKNSSSSKSTTSAKEDKPHQRPSDIKKPDSIKNRWTTESYDRQFDSVKLKRSSIDDPAERNLHRPNFHTTNFHDDDIQDIACPGTCGGKCSKGHQVVPVDWSELLRDREENETEKFIAAPTLDELNKNKEKCTDFKVQQGSTILPDNNFVQAVRTTHITSTGGNISWIDSGNILNNDGDSSAVLKKNRNVINNFEGNYIGVSQDVLERLSKQVDIQEANTSESATSNVTEKRTDGSEESSNQEINSLSGESDIPNNKATNSQASESENLSECNDNASKYAPNTKLNWNENSSGEEETEKSCENRIFSSSSSSSSISTERFGILPAIMSDKPVASNTSTTESQRQKKVSKEVQEQSQNLNNDFHTRTVTCTNYYMYLQANRAKSRILEMLMKTHNPSKYCDSLDSDDCSVADHDEVTSEPIEQVEEMKQESTNSQADDGGDACDKQTKTLLDEKFGAETDYVTEKESETVQEEEKAVLDGSELRNITDSTSVTIEKNQPIPGDIPVFNDLDIESDTEEFDVQMQLPDIFRNAN